MCKQRLLQSKSGHCKVTLGVHITRKHSKTCIDFHFWPFHSIYLAHFWRWDDFYEMHPMLRGEHVECMDSEDVLRWYLIPRVDPNPNVDFKYLILMIPRIMSRDYGAPPNHISKATRCYPDNLLFHINCQWQASILSSKLTELRWRLRQSSKRSSFFSFFAQWASHSNWMNWNVLKSEWVDHVLYWIVLQ